jgi:HEPN domain-containing protein
LPTGGRKGGESIFGVQEISPAKTHDIRKLAIEAAEIEPLFDKLIPAAATLTPYAWEFRYPDDLAETYPTPEEFDEALKHAQTIYDFVLKLLPPAARP